MTGAVCERMRKAALGNVWSGHGDGIDTEDAARVEEAWQRMSDANHKLLLRWYYVRRSHPDLICRKLKLRIRPFSVFTVARFNAEQAIEEALDKIQSGNRIRINNLLPSAKTSDSTRGAALSGEIEALD